MALLLAAAVTCSPGSAAPVRSACEIRCEITRVEGSTVALSISRHADLLRPGTGLAVVEGETVVGRVQLEAVSEDTAVGTIVEPGATTAFRTGLTAVAPCPLPITAVANGQPVVALPPGYELATGAPLSVWRKGNEIARGELIAPDHGPAHVRTGEQAPTLRVGDVCYAEVSSGKPSVPRPPTKPADASAGKLVVTATEEDAVYLSFGSTPLQERPTGRYVVEREGRTIAVVEALPSGPLRARVESLAPGERPVAGDVAVPLADGVDIVVLQPREEEPATTPEPARETTTPPPEPTSQQEATGTQTPAATDEGDASTLAGERVATAPEPPLASQAPGSSRPRPLPKAPPLGATFHGPTGLIRTPNAEVLPENTIRASLTEPAEVSGSTVPDFREQWGWTVGLLPGVEVGGAYNNDPLRDLTFHAKVRLRPERAGWPAIAAGASNLRANAGVSNYYLVGSKTLLDGRVRASLGWSDGELDGAFGGLEGRLAPWATVLVEYDGDRVNTGLRLTAAERLQIDLADTEGGFSTQVAYWFDMGGGGEEAPFVRLERPQHDLDVQAAAAALAEAIIALGMENVRVIVGDTPRGLTAGVTYENRRYYRDELEALGYVLAAAAQTLPPRFDYISVVALDHQVPVLRFTTGIGDYVAFISGDLSQARFEDMVTIDHGVRPEIPPDRVAAATRTASSTRLTADVTVTPVIRTLFGSEEVTLAVRHGVRPEVDLDLGNGWSVRAGQEIHTGGHLGPELDPLRSDDHANLNYTFRMGSQLMGHLAGGEFPDERRGLAAEGFWLGGGGLLARGYAGWLEDRRFTYFGGEPDPEWSYLGDVRYWVSGLDVEAGVSFGEYLDGDKGFTLSLRKLMADNAITFEYRDTDYAEVLLFGVTVPLTPRRVARPSPVRLRMGDTFSTSWRSTLGTDTNEGTVQTAAYTGNQVRLFDISDRFLNRDRFNRGFVLDRLDALRRAAAKSRTVGTR